MTSLSEQALAVTLATSLESAKVYSATVYPISSNMGVMVSAWNLELGSPEQ